MNILFVAPYTPYPLDGGGKIRLYSFLKHLSQQHEVNLISFDSTPIDQDGRYNLERICSHFVSVPKPDGNKRARQLASVMSRHSYQRLTYFSQQMQDAINDFASRHRPDIIQIEHAQMAYYALPAETYKVLDEHNVEHEVLYRTYSNEAMSVRKIYNWLEWKKFRRDELMLCARFDLCLTTSDRDRVKLEELVPSIKVTVIPNGVDVAGYTSGGVVEEEPASLVFTGSLDYYPNTDAVRFFVEQVLPLIRRSLPNVKLYVVGKDAPPQIQRYCDEPGVVITGYVDDVREYLERAAVAIVPLRVGGGTRLKILEALAMSRPVVSTPIGAEGLGETEGAGVLLADGPAAFAEAVVSLLRDRQLRAQLAQRGRRLVEQQFDWKLVVRRLESAYYSIVAGG